MIHIRLFVRNSGKWRPGPYIEIADHYAFSFFFQIALHSISSESFDTLDTGIARVISGRVPRHIESIHDCTLTLVDDMAYAQYEADVACAERIVNSLSLVHFNAILCVWRDFVSDVEQNSRKRGFTYTLT